VEELRGLVQKAKAAGGSLNAVPGAAARALPFWFEGLPAPESYTDDNGQAVVKGHQASLLKTALLDIFSADAPDGSQTVNLLHLILYACADTQKEGVEKAVKVLGNAQGHVDAQTLLPILSLGVYPLRAFGAVRKEHELLQARCREGARLLAACGIRSSCA
jgi:hypothetical protein